MASDYSQDPQRKSSLAIKDRKDKLPGAERRQCYPDLDQITNVRGGTRDMLQTACFHLCDILVCTKYQVGRMRCLGNDIFGLDWI